jgi:hypothetical protein
MTGRVAEFLAKAAADPVELTVGDLLAVWGFGYRIYDSVGRVEQDLAAAGLNCQPPLADGSMSTIVRVGAPEAIGRAETEEAAQDAAWEEGAAAETDEQLVLPHFSLRVRDVPSAVGGVTAIQPSHTLEQAQHIMMTKGFSQLAVMDEPQLRGAVSWESIAQLRVSQAHFGLADAIEPFPEIVYADQKLLDQIGTIYRAGFVFVRESDESICGIVTTADLSMAFSDLATPFFQLGEIERRLRHCVGQAFTLDELRQATRRPNLGSVDNMMLGQYCRLLEDTGRWQQLHWSLDQEMFVGDLDRVRQIRNHVAHFGAEPLTGEQKQQLTDFLHFMRHLVTLS